MAKHLSIKELKALSRALQTQIETKYCPKKHLSFVKEVHGGVNIDKNGVKFWGNDWSVLLRKY